MVDFSNYDSINGFGEIARRYSAKLSELRLPDMHFIFIVPQRMKGQFGSHIDYVAKEHVRDELKRLRLNIDLWHATDQFFRYRKKSGETLQLLTIHDLNFLVEKKGLHKLRYELMMRRRIAQTDKIVAISRYVAGDIADFAGVPESSISVVYNGIHNVEHDLRVRPPFVHSDDEPFFFTVGTVRAKKNFKVLVPMMDYFPDMKLYICGVNKWKYGEEIRRCIRPEDRKRIVLAGEISEAEKCWMYSRCRAFLFPSLVEGFGLPVLEAMRFGCKVFSSRCTSLPEICRQHADYWDSFDPQDMADVVRNGIDGWSREGRSAVDAAAYSKTFSYERYTDMYVGLYREMLDIK